LTQRLPKLRGLKRFFKLQDKYQALNLASIQRDERFTDGSTVTHENLVIRGYTDKNDKVKILGNGEFTKKLSFTNEFVFSATAKEKITAAGGSIA
jgi:large subunit ribosomal protein L15